MRYYRKILFGGVLLLTTFFMVTVFMMSLNMQIAHTRQPKVQIEINGEQATFIDAHPYIDENNRTMVPIRFICEKLGGEVGWDSSTNTVSVRNKEMIIELQVDSDIIFVNGEEEQMDTSMVFNEEFNRNYVPLRFVSENLGSQVSFEDQGSVRKVFVTYNTKVSDDLEEAKDFAETEGLKTSDEGIYGILLGDSEEDVLKQLNEPARKEPSAYGYDWWVYNQDYDNYLQVGIKDGKVVNIYSNSDQWEYKGLKLGLTIKEVKNLFPYEESIEYIHDGTKYTIKQNDKKPVEKYLVINDDNIALEIYFDIHQGGQVTAVRLSEPIFVLHSGSYSMSWWRQGNSLEDVAGSLSEKEQQEVDRANERQLKDLVNSIRVRMGLNPLDWHDEIAEVAYEHSQDMKNNNFFGHVSPTTGSPIDRVKDAEIHFYLMGENLAYGQADAIEAHEGLMNSYDHREAILLPDYTALGVGVYYKYYTQKFITPR